jgi:hypothetical protein
MNDNHKDDFLDGITLPCRTVAAGKVRRIDRAAEGRLYQCGTMISWELDECRGHFSDDDFGLIAAAGLARAIGSFDAETEVLARPVDEQIAGVSLEPTMANWQRLRFLRKQLKHLYARRDREFERRFPSLRGELETASKPDFPELSSETWEMWDFTA